MTPEDTPIAYIPIHGTWASTAKPEAWWQPTSAFARFLADQGFSYFRPGDPFRWSGDINGWQLWRRWRWLRWMLRTSESGDENDWIAAGHALRWYLMGSAYEDRQVIAHSHGLQPVLYACAGGLHVRRLISVGSPVRRDQLDVGRRARPTIDQWLHIASIDDEVQALGEIGDGRIGVQRAHPYADRNDVMSGLEHSDVLRDSRRFRLWVDRGWLQFLKE